MRYIDQWLSGLGLDHIIPLLQEHGITTPNKLAALSLRDMYEVVGVNDAEDRKKLHFLIQRLQNILKKTPDNGENKSEEDNAKEHSRTESPQPREEQRGSNSAPARNPYISPVRHHTTNTQEVSSNDYNDRNEGESSGDENDLRVLRRQPRDVPPASLKRSPEKFAHVKDANSELIRVHSPIEVKSSSNPPSPSHHPASTRHRAPPSSRSPEKDTVPEQNRRRLLSHMPETYSASAAVTTSEDTAREEEAFRRIQLQQQQQLLRKRDGFAINPTSNVHSAGVTSTHETQLYTKRSNIQSQRRALSPPPSPPPAPPPVLDDRDTRLSVKSSISSARAPYNPVAYVRHPPASAVDAPEPSHTLARSGWLAGAIEYNNSDDDMAIRVVVRKRPLSKSEDNRGDKDVLDIHPGGQVLVHEPKTKVDLTKVVETQEFFFDDAFDEVCSNEKIYGRVIWPLVRTAMQGGKASCFAYGQTGSGKTFTMMGSSPTTPSQVKVNAGLYVLAARDMFRLLAKSNSPDERKAKQVMVSCFEIYGGKLFDLLNERGVVRCLEDAKQQVQLPGLTEHKVADVDELLEMMAKAHEQRSTGSTGANLESSRSHQVLQLSLQTMHEIPGRTKRTVLRKVGQLTFIDLAGSERGADTTHNSKQTRMEGAEINTSLLALKEVIRSLEKKQGHTPFRGSKLTQVLKDSFVGENTRTCMVACVSPTNVNCEHTLNTLRYADRVKEHQQSRTKDDSAMERPSTSAGMGGYDKAPRSVSAQPMRPSTAQPPPSVGVGSAAGGRGVVRRGSDVNKAGGTTGPVRGIPPASPSHREMYRAASIGTPSKRERPMTSQTSHSSPEEPFYPSSPARGLKKLPVASAPPAEAPVKSGFRLHRGGNNAIPTYSAKPAGLRQSLDPREEEEPRKSAANMSSPVTSSRKRHSGGSGSDSLMDSNGSSMSAPPPPPEGFPDSNGELITSRVSLSLLANVPRPQPVAGRGLEGLLSDDDDDFDKEKNDDNRRGSYEDDDEDDEESDGDFDGDDINVAEEALIFNYDDNNSLGGTALIQKTVELVSAHKMTIAEMVEFMKEEMELVQDMEQSDPRDTVKYISSLEHLLRAKSESIDALQEVLQGFRTFRGAERKHLPQW